MVSCWRYDKRSFSTGGKSDTVGQVRKDFRVELEKGENMNPSVRFMSAVLDDVGNSRRKRTRSTSNNITRTYTLGGYGGHEDIQERAFCRDAGIAGGAGGTDPKLTRASDRRKHPGRVLDPAGAPIPQASVTATK